MEFKLRPWNMNDLDSLVKQANNYNIARFMTDQFPHPYLPENGITFITIASQEPIRMFAIEVEGNAVGGIGIHPQNDIMSKNAEIGYWIGEEFSNKGIISRAIPQMIRFAFEIFPINRLYARVFENNLASQKVLEKNGFHLEARFEKTIYKYNEFLDELIYAVRKQ